MDFRLPCECGRHLSVTEGAAGATLQCVCGRTVKVPSLGELGRQFTVEAEGPTAARQAGESDRTADAASWLPWLWIAGGVYMLVQSGWPPRVLVFSIAYCVAIAIGVGLWFIDRCEAFRSWRVVIRYVLLGGVLAVLAAALGWEVMERHAQR
jgi:Domain of unknown function (DUF1922)